MGYPPPVAESDPDLSMIDGNASPVPGLPAPENLNREPDAGPAQYGAINAVYAALFAAVLVATRGNDTEAERLGSAELLPLTAATFSISKIVAREKVGSWVREPFVDDPVGRKQPRGGRFQRALSRTLRRAMPWAKRRTHTARCATFEF